MVFRLSLLEHFLNKIDSYNASNNSSNLPVGTIFYWAASSREPAGKAIEDMNLKQIRLSLNASTDITVLRENGMQALREAKIARITGEARDQDAYLTQEDIAVLLCSRARTITFLTFIVGKFHDSDNLKKIYFVSFGFTVGVIQ